MSDFAQMLPMMSSRAVQAGGGGISIIKGETVTQSVRTVRVDILANVLASSRNPPPISAICVTVVLKLMVLPIVWRLPGARRIEDIVPVTNLWPI